MWYFQFTSKFASQVRMEPSKISFEMDEGFNRSEVRKSLYHFQTGMFGFEKECLEKTRKQSVNKIIKIVYIFLSPLNQLLAYSVLPVTYIL